eukprot:TRINITY_DN51257_c0_g1_i1.p1 TRINITY_DN51257_c0_g1~~TRINITY_DN51257_c0_g1_i1.p1  ORF type:complete len:172 (-),score=16.94 TRINITY_DN51257_c0_g1_i1:496-1011(-)
MANPGGSSASSSHQPPLVPPARDRIDPAELVLPHWSGDRFLFQAAGAPPGLPAPSASSAAAAAVQEAPLRSRSRDRASARTRRESRQPGDPRDPRIDTILEQFSTTLSEHRDNKRSLKCKGLPKQMHADLIRIERSLGKNLIKYAHTQQRLNDLSKATDTGKTVYKFPRAC